LRRPQAGGNILQVDAYARPRVKSAAHRIDEDVGGREMSGRVRMTRLPALEARERILFPSCASNLDERPSRRTAPGRLDA
jgi:hypothetical protein